VNEVGVHLPASDGHVAHGERVHLVGRQRLLLGHIHHVVSGRVDHQIRFSLGDVTLHVHGVGDVQVGPRERLDLKTRVTKDGAEFDA